MKSFEQWALYFGLSMEMVPDFIIAVSMIVLLRARKNDILACAHTMSSTVQTVDTIILYSLGSGFLTLYVAPVNYQSCIR